MKTLAISNDIEKELIHSLGIEILEEEPVRFSDEATRIIKNYIEKEKEN